MAARQNDFELIPRDSLPRPQDRRVDLLAIITQGASICAAITLHDGKFTISVNKESQAAISYSQKIFSNLCTVAQLSSGLAALLQNSIFYLNPTEEIDKILNNLENGTAAFIFKQEKLLFVYKNNKGKSFKEGVVLSEERLGAILQVKIDPNDKNTLKIPLSRINFLSLLQYTSSKDLLRIFRQNIKRPFDHLKSQLLNQTSIIPNPDTTSEILFIEAPIDVRLHKIINSIIDTYISPDCPTSFGQFAQAIFLSESNFDFINAEAIVAAGSSSKSKKISAPPMSEGYDKQAASSSMAYSGEDIVRDESTSKSTQDVHAELKIIDELFKRSAIKPNNKTPYYIGISKPCCPLCKCVIAAVNAIYGADTIITRQSEHAQINPAGIPEFLKKNDDIRRNFLNRFLEYSDNSSQMLPIDEMQSLSFSKIVTEHPDIALKLIFSGNVRIQTTSRSRLSDSPVDFLRNIELLEKEVARFAGQVISHQDTINDKISPLFDGMRRRSVSLNNLTSKTTTQQPDKKHKRKPSAPF